MHERVDVCVHRGVGVFDANVEDGPVDAGTEKKYLDVFLSINIIVHPTLKMGRSMQV
jgi:hypothetical protein